MQDAIKVEQLTKFYGSLLSVDNLSFTVAQGTIFGLLGANGAGKSTTIECILGVKKQSKGQISVLGMNPLKERKKLFQKVGVQFQEVGYQDNITVRELCDVTESLYPVAESSLNLLKMFGLGDKQKSLVKELSGGQRQRLFIVLALIPRPEVVFLDELTTGLDAKARREVWKILSALRQNGLTILLTSHFMDEVEALCDNICILKRGRAVFHGTVAQAIAASPGHNFEDAYLWFTDEEELSDENF